ncbi:hypothetical protein PV762_04165 [Mitsuaria sp. CC2]|uniref:hypothetical protein n=1 Tax=Mitsuaria sp. CC2 TaxID=3029186 RepID=UPI003B8CAB47
MGTLTKNGVTLTYRYDAGGQRVHKEHSQGMRYFAYDLDGKMLGEYNATSQVHEYVWLGDMPVAVMTGSGPEPTVLYVWDHNTGYFGSGPLLRRRGWIGGCIWLLGGEKGERLRY